MSLPVALRTYAPSTDRNFVFASWIGSYRQSPWSGTIPAHLEYEIHKVTINQLLARGMKVTMAVNPADDQQLIGYIAYEPGLLHFVFCKDVFRRQGVARLLMASAHFDQSRPILASFRTADARYLGDIVHKPGLARMKRAFEVADARS